MGEKVKQIRRVCTACGKVSYYSRKSKPASCPFCHDRYWDKPHDERDLFLLQEAYYNQNRSSKILGEMYLKIVTYSENIIKMQLKRKGKIYPKDLLEERAEEMALSFIEKYLKNPNYIIKHSFGGLLKKVVLGILYGKSVKDPDKEMSLDAEIENKFTVFDNPAFFIKDPLSEEVFRSTYEQDAYDEALKSTESYIPEELTGFINEMSERIRVSQGYSRNLLFLIGMRNFLNKKISMVDYYSYCNNIDRQNIENAKLLVRRYLLDRMRS